MPYENGFSIDINSVNFCDSNGTILGKIEDIQDFQVEMYEPDSDVDEIWPKRIDIEKSYTCGFTIDSSRMWNRLNRILLGWKAKGPIRKRLIYKLLKVREGTPWKS